MIFQNTDLNIYFRSSNLFFLHRGVEKNFVCVKNFFQ